MKLHQRIRHYAQSPRLGILLLCVLVSATVAWVQLSGRNRPLPSQKVAFEAQFSQPMIVQGEDGTVYLNLSVTTPEAETLLPEEGASDLILVLDRSGSMGEGNKWQFATRAVHSLLDRLTPSDRIGFVTFDTSGRLEMPLVTATADAIKRLRRRIDQLAPGENTNLGEGLLLAQSQLRHYPASGRRRRVILLSDGHANQGITDLNDLNRLAARIADEGAVVSSIGMGLGFNEVLMASLADHGMGRFSFLESLESLGSILAAELSQSRQVFANGSEVQLELPPGVELTDAAGFPFLMQGRTAVVRTGQLLSGRQKEFIFTLQVDNRRPANYRLAHVGLTYLRNGERYLQEIQSENLHVACVAPERKPEAVASVDQEVYRDAWIRNNLGSLMKSVSNLVRAGNEEAARAILGDYRSRAEEAEQAAAVPGLADEVKSQLSELEAKVDDAFHGADQKVKQNRAAKELYGASQKLQRVQKKNP